MKFLQIVLLQLLTFLSITAQEFSATERAWLMHVVEQTPILSRNMKQYVEYDRDLFFVHSSKGIYFDAVKAEDYLKGHPSELNINFEEISHQPLGLLSELATKMAIWELIQSSEDDYKLLGDSGYVALIFPLHRYLPEKIREKPSSKKALRILRIVMHPSLPLKVKSKQLSDLNVEMRDQQRLLMEWSRVIESWIQKRGLSFFHRLVKRSEVFQLEMIAAGDGSGTSGMLGEKHQVQIDTSLVEYGKGCGLFTYQFEKSRNAVLPKSYDEKKISFKASGANAIHCSLWGLDGINKPMLVIDDGNTTYHLFSDGFQLTPDGGRNGGLSLIDQIQELTIRQVEKPTQKLLQDGGLSEMLQDEIDRKTELENNVARIEQEIDTLRKSGVSQDELNSRLDQLSSMQLKIAARLRRITELSRKISVQESKVNQAGEKIGDLKKLLGNAPLSWKMNEPNYEFENGVIFDPSYQDLIFAENQPDTLTMRLISPAMTLQGKSRDEVQLLACLIQVPVKEKANAIDMFVQPQDSLFDLYYYPDEIEPFTSVDNLVSFIKAQKKKVIDVRIQTLVPPMVHNAQYAHPEQERELPLTEYGKMRKSQVCVKVTDEAIEIEIVSGTDPVATRLSLLSLEERKTNSITTCEYRNNILLAELRAMYLKELLENL